jgi:hypothetical protein
LSETTSHISGSPGTRTSRRSRTTSNRRTIASLIGLISQSQIDADIRIEHPRANIGPKPNSRLIAGEAEGNGGGILTNASLRDGRRSDPGKCTSHRPSIGSISTKHRLLSAKNRAQIGKPLLGLLGGKVAIGELGLKILRCPELKAALTGLLVSQRSLQVGRLIGLLNALKVGDVELLRLHPRLLIGKGCA